MTFPGIVINSARRQLGSYIALIISSAFAVMAFYIFSSLYFDEQISSAMEEGAQKLFMLLMVSAVLIGLFSVVFLWYSTGLFIRRKKKIIGTLSLLGMSPGKIWKMLSAEILIIGVLSIAAGIVIGMMFLKLCALILLFAMRMKELSTIGISALPIALTSVVFVLLFLFISLRIYVFCAGNRLIKLFNAVRETDKPPRNTFFKTVLAVLLVGCGYYLAAIMKRTALFLSSETRFDLLQLMVFILVVTITGTLFLYSGLFSFLAARIKNWCFRKGKTAAHLALSNALFNLQNSNTLLTLSAVLHAVTITAIGAFLVFFIQYNDTVQEFRFLTPMTFNKQFEDEQQYREWLADIKAHGFTGFIENDLPFLKLETAPAASFGPETGYAAPYSEYASRAELLGYHFPEQQKEDRALLIVQIPEKKQQYEYLLPEEGGYLTFSGQNRLPVTAVLTQAIVPDVKFFFVIPDYLFRELASAGGAREIIFGGIEVEPLAAAEEMHNYIVSMDPRMEMYSSFGLLRTLNQTIGLLLFAGVFIGATLTVGNICLLVFRQLMEAADRKKAFGILDNIGLSSRDRKKVILINTALFFLVPLGTGFFHALFALKALEQFVNMPTAESLAMITAVVLAVTLVFLRVSAGIYENQIRLEIQI